MSQVYPPIFPGLAHNQAVKAEHGLIGTSEYYNFQAEILLIFLLQVGISRANLQDTCSTIMANKNKLREINERVTQSGRRSTPSPTVVCAQSNQQLRAIWPVVKWQGVGIAQDTPREEPVRDEE